MLPKASKQRLGSHFCQGILERLEQEMTIKGTSLVVQGLKLHTPNGGGTGLTGEQRCHLHAHRVCPTPPPKKKRGKER